MCLLFGGNVSVLVNTVDPVLVTSICHIPSLQGVKETWSSSDPGSFCLVGKETTRQGRGWDPPSMYVGCHVWTR